MAEVIKLEDDDSVAALILSKDELFILTMFLGRMNGYGFTDLWNDVPHKFKDYPIWEVDHYSEKYIKPNLIDLHSFEEKFGKTKRLGEK